jgi:hypothetical protein
MSETPQGGTGEATAGGTVKALHMAIIDAGRPRWRDIRTWMDAFEKMLNRAHRLERELAAAQKKHEFTYCAYCGQEYPLADPECADKVGAHIAACEKHPMRQVEKQLAAAQARLGNCEDGRAYADGKRLEAENQLAAARARIEALEGVLAETTGVSRIAAERTRQMEAEGFSLDHDDQHTDGELALAAAAYAIPAECRDFAENGTPFPFPDTWSPEWWKPSVDRVRELTKAGALIAAEIDRLVRRALAASREAGAFIHDQKEPR